MTRCLLVLVLVAATPVAMAEKKPTVAQAKATNEGAFKKALGKLKLKVIKLASVPAEHDESTGLIHFVGNVVHDGAGHHDPTFVVDANKGVFRVVRKINPVGRVKHRVCHAKRPIRVKRTRFDVPVGHTFQGDVEVAYDAYVIDEECR